MSSVGRMRTVLRWEGVPGLLRRAIRATFRPFVRVRRVIFYEIDLTQPVVPLVARVPLELRVVGREDFETLAPELATLGVDLAAAREQLERGDLLTVGRSGPALVHMGWVCFSSPWIVEIDARLTLGPTEACGYGAWTHPDWRGRGIQPVGALFRDEVMRARGYTRHISWVWADNFANRHQTKRGRRRTKTVLSVWVRGMRRPLLFGATRTGSPSLGRPRRPA